MADYQNVLVGIDGSKQSMMAFHKAIDLAKKNHAKLQLLSVVNGEHYPTAAGYGIIDRDMYDAAVARMKKTLGELAEEAKKADLADVETTVMVGNAKIAITDQYPKKHDVDLIVVGATGLNVIGRIIVGSTAAYVIRHAPCDVMVVKTDENNEKVKVEDVSYPEI
ncbi:universal stress protein [Limosilactobacillus caecicola]|uniref:universal stress protein n=1 Tax=Limosilactobacillus caecicola TaxID=2941332 RepID=UPI00203DEC60|nr:universal stress protein [Limosilactobacillus caecicola]